MTNTIKVAPRGVSRRRRGTERDQRSARQARYLFETSPSSPDRTALSEPHDREEPAMATTTTPTTVTLTVQVPHDLADALAPFDGDLRLESYHVTALLRDMIRELADDLVRIADDGADPQAADLRIEQVAAATAAVAW
jgi:hypothetical protein